MSAQAEEIARRFGIDLARLPKHVAIIMDGNGRWAKKQFKPRFFGHRNGAIRAREIIEAAGNLGIKALTLFAFSDDNWKRPSTEVSALMSLLNSFLKQEFENIKKKNIRLETIGDISRLPATSQKILRDVKLSSRHNDGMTVTLALSYGGRAEIAAACRRIATSLKEGLISEDDITTDLISAHLQTNQVPELDLLIRTSGEYRISNFLLWQLAYAELYFTQTLWPDFTDTEFYQAIANYQSRERRFGEVGASGGDSEDIGPVDDLLPQQDQICSSSEY